MDKYREFFHEYTAGFDLTLNPIWRKHEHTMRVVENSRQIAESLKLPRHAVELAEMIGLFHDIGRFEQWRTYQSYNDYETTDHAELSLKVIEENGILREFGGYDIFVSAIKNHNKLKINPKITDDRELTFCKIIRDADKLDILRQFLTGELGLSKTYRRYSDKALKDAMSHRLINRKNVTNEADYALAELALFNDINFEYTKNCIRNEFLIEKMTQRFIEANPKQKDALIRVEKAIKLYY